MTVNTKTAQGRRTVRYESFDDLLAEAEQLAAGEITCLGNWSPGQVFDHLGRSLEVSIDGGAPKPPLPVRLVANLFFRKKFIYESVPSGFQISNSAAKFFKPEDGVETQQGLEKLRNGVERCKAEEKRADHPIFGKISKAEWDSFSLRHAEMHMSFLKPAGGES
ncbi:MAG: DUF1569 domain-containing protein [Planctomycetota bacterium]